LPPYNVFVATNPVPDPIEEEALRVLDANPRLRERLKDFHRRFKLGEELTLHEHDEARRIVGLESLSPPDQPAD
jgi:hypothetical protein